MSDAVVNGHFVWECRYVIPFGEGYKMQGLDAALRDAVSSAIVDFVTANAPGADVHRLLACTHHPFTSFGQFVTEAEMAVIEDRDPDPLLITQYHLGKALEHSKMAAAAVEHARLLLLKKDPLHSTEGEPQHD